MAPSAKPRWRYPERVAAMALEWADAQRRWGIAPEPLEHVVDRTEEVREVAGG